MRAVPIHVAVALVAVGVPPAIGQPAARPLQVGTPIEQSILGSDVHVYTFTAGPNSTVAAVVINKVPLVTVMVREGARALRPDLDDMARIFRMTPSARLRHVVLPQMAPYIAGAARAGLSLIWKIVLVVEFLGRSSGVGFQIHLNFSMFRVAHILAYAFAFILVMLVIEYLILRPLERHAGRWRQDGH